MMGGDTPKTCGDTRKRQVINLWNFCILLVKLFGPYVDAQTGERQIQMFSYKKLLNKNGLVVP